MGIATYIASQLRKPHGVGGMVFGKIMNKKNQHLNSFILKLLNVQPQDKILEIGFGNGTQIQQIAAKTTEGQVSGIDMSGTMVNQAKKLNKANIDAGTVEIRLASTAEIPYQEKIFDKVLTSNTIYFWSNPKKDLREIYRVLKTNGQLFLGFRTKEQLKNAAFTKHGFQLYQIPEIVALLESSGFSKVQVQIEKTDGLDSYCAIATR